LPTATGVKALNFSGKHGFEGYQGNSVLSEDPRAGLSETLVPDMAELYRPGEQVPNSNVASRSLLVKNNWYLPRNQQINLHYMDTKIRFGEINPFINSLLLGFSGLWNNTTQKRYEIVPIQGIDSNIRSRTYKLGYQWQPEGSRWIDLKADIWRVNTTSIRHQSGGPDLAVPYGDTKYDAWARCFRHNVEPYLAQGYSCQDLLNEGYNADTPPNDPPIVDGANTVFAGSRQTTKVSRTGSKATTNGRIANATMRVRPTPQPETARRSTITQHHHSSTTVATINTKLLTHSGNGAKAEKTIAEIGG